MARETSYGVCELCGQRFSKAGMSRHITKCAPEHEPAGRRKVEWIHLHIEGDGAPMYWMNVEMRSQAKLSELDQFLRDIWLECCGHMSAFRIGETDFVMPFFDNGWSMREQRSMNVTLEKALQGVDRFTHEYDFGTTTYLKLRVVGRRQSSASGDHIRLLARNEPPDWRCGVCGQPATIICTECMWGDTNPFLCDEHAEEHECGEEMQLPVVNSPRMGMCGYDGGVW